HPPPRGLRHQLKLDRKQPGLKDRVVPSSGTGHERRFHILIAEQALYTTVGNDAVMIGQLDRLMAVIGLSRVQLGIIPAQAGPPMQTTNFVMFDSRMVTVEGITAELTITQPREVAIYSRAFDTLAGGSVTGEAARKLIGAALDKRRGRRP
ncbi:Scr1 family TA system antitoxin-like transcriptional regulator, partial [Nocardia sp. NPDC004604]|uniref:Scr1 family TA system antitoxin-like transcriptional regulator n=1 Tax=Nocardia sp. NPDC004604 TaxID=3157013 RepID=UPI0033B8BBBA